MKYIYYFKEFVINMESNFLNKNLCILEKQTLEQLQPVYY